MSDSTTDLRSLDATINVAMCSRVLMQNQVKNASRTGAMIRGVHLTFMAPAVIEVLRSVGLQFVYIDGEHGCFDWRDIEAMCIAAERHGLTMIARVPDASVATITRFLDRGVRGIVVPHVESVADACRVVEATYYSPLGSRSFGAGRPEYGQGIVDRRAYYDDCNAGISLCVMIESQTGAENAREIAAVPGVDYLSFGLFDLSQSLGYPGEVKHASVVAAVAEATAGIHAAGKRVREDFMTYCWINDILVAGARQLLGGCEQISATR